MMNTNVKDYAHKSDDSTWQAVYLNSQHRLYHNDFPITGYVFVNDKGEYAVDGFEHMVRIPAPIARSWDYVTVDGLKVSYMTGYLMKNTRGEYACEVGHACLVAVSLCIAATLLTKGN